jgi:hypothetical protein
MASRSGTGIFPVGSSFRFPEGQSGKGTKANAIRSVGKTQKAPATSSSLRPQKPGKQHRQAAQTLSFFAITLEEEVARWLRVWAAEHDTSVSRFVGRLVEERMNAERQYEQSKQSFLSRQPRPLKRSGGYPSREEVHER